MSLSLHSGPASIESEETRGQLDCALAMSSVYDFAGDKSGEQAELRILGKGLRQENLPKDSLIKLLKQAGEVLEQASQEESSREAASELAMALVHKSVIKHRDKGVRVSAAYCLSNVLRLYAAETDLPWDLPQQEEVFILFIWTFRLLETANSPLFTKCLSILELIGQTKCCVLMLDWDSEDIVCDLFQVMCEAINPSNKEQIWAPALEVMAGIVEETDKMPQQLLDTMLSYLLPPACEEHPEACEMIGQLLQRTERLIQPPLQRYLTSMIDGTCTQSDLKDEYHLLIYQVYKLCPQVLLPVLPHLDGELRTPVESHRIAAVQLLGKLLALPGSTIAEDHPELFDALLQRCKDAKGPVRVVALHTCSDLLHSLASHAKQQEVLQLLAERMLDPDDKVRAAACACVCKAAVADLQSMTVKALHSVCIRLRDTKLAVRKEAAAQLFSVFRTHCSAARVGEVTSAEELVAWIPGRVLLHANDMGQYIWDVVLKPGLLPAKLSPADAARHWTAIFLAANAKERQSLMEKVGARERLQAAVRHFLDLRAAKDSAKAGELKNALAQIAQMFADTSRALEHLLKISQMKDNNIFKDLSGLLQPSLDLPAASALAKSFLQRIGSRGATADFARSMCAILAPSLLPTSTVQGLLELAEQLVLDDSGSDFCQASLQLLVAAADAAPSLYSQLGSKVAGMLGSEDAMLGHAATRILAAAGSDIAAAHSRAEGAELDLQHLACKLTELMARGPYKVTKAAVRALVRSLPAEQVQETLQPLCRDILGRMADDSRLLSQGNLGAVLQTVSSIGQLQPGIFAPHAPAFAAFVLHTLLPADPGVFAKSKQAKQKQSMQPGGVALVKAFAVKALARACTPDMRSMRPAAAADMQGPLLEAVDETIQELSFWLDAGDLMDLGCSAGDDAAVMRLACATGLLRLCRLHSDRLSPERYMLLALSMQDPARFVRSMFGQKVHRTVTVFDKCKTNQKAAKYAAMLPLAAVDPNSANQQAAYAYLQNYVASRRGKVQERVAAAVATHAAEGGTTMHEHPDFLLPFLVQILAHHSDFPLEEDVADDALRAYTPFMRMLQFGLEALLLPSSSTDAPGAMLPAILKTLHNLKRTKDITAQPAQQNIYIVCDLALLLVPAIMQAYAPAAAPPSTFPGSIPLPIAFFTPDESPINGRDGETLPGGFTAELAPPFHKQGHSGSTTTAKKRRRPATQAAKAGGKAPQGTQAAAGRKAVDGSGTPGGHPKSQQSRRKVPKSSSTASPGSSISHQGAMTGLVAPSEHEEDADDIESPSQDDSSSDEDEKPPRKTQALAALPTRARRSATEPTTTGSKIRRKQDNDSEGRPPADVAMQDACSPDNSLSPPSEGPSSHTHSPDENDPAHNNSSQPLDSAVPSKSKRKLSQASPKQLPHIAEHGKPSKVKGKGVLSQGPNANPNGKATSGSTASRSRGKAKPAWKEEAPTRAQPRRGAKDQAVVNMSGSGRSVGTPSP